MKRLLLTLCILMPLMAADYPNLTTWAYQYDSDVALAWMQPKPPRTCGVWISVWVSDPRVEALSLTVFYVNEGRELAKTEVIRIVPRTGAGADWTSTMFALADHPVQVRSIAVTALLPGESRTVGTGLH